MKRFSFLLLMSISTLYGMAQEELTLGEFLQTMQKNNLQYQIEKYNIDKANAEASAQKVIADPELSFDSSKELYALDLSYELEFSKRSARINLAKENVKNEQLSVDLFYNELYAEAINAYIDTKLKWELLLVKESSYKYMLQLSISDSIRYAQGEINKIDALQSKIEAATLYNEMLSQQVDYKLGVAILNRYMERKSDTQIIFPNETKISQIDYSLNELIMKGLSLRVDIKLMEQHGKLAKANLRFTKSERVPNAIIHMGYERNWKDTRWSTDLFTAGVSIPLKLSNFNKGAIRSAQFTVKQSELALINMHEQVEFEITQAYIQYQINKEKVDQYLSLLLIDSKRVLDGMMFKYQRGETGILDMLMAQRTYNNIQEEYFNTLKEYLSAVVELQRSCGYWNLFS